MMTHDPSRPPPAPPIVTDPDPFGEPFPTPAALLPPTPLADTLPAATTTSAHRLRRWQAALRDAVLLLVLVAAAYLFVNMATTRAMINGYSMQPELLDGDVVLVNRVAYVISQPQRGDVVVIRPPAALCTNPNVRSSRCQPLIKRIIGLPGEDVQLIAGYVYVDGIKLEEPYIIPENFCGRSCDAAFTLGEDEYLVLGDNRLRSYDGHYFGPIKGATIIGQAWLRYWPLDRLQFIHHPRYDTLTAAAKERP